MKRFSCLVLCVCFLCGCTSAKQPMDQALDFRNKILNSGSCSFTAEVQATIDEDIYVFQMECIAEHTGILKFTVTEPETIAGVGGEISTSGASLNFDDVVLSVPMVADGRLNPLSSPWVLINSLRSGYLSGIGGYENGFLLSIDDSYKEDALRLNVYTTNDFTPQRTEIYHNGICIIAMQIDDFCIQ